MMGAKAKLVISIALFVVALDQASKWLVQGSMALHESVPVISGIFHLTYIRNTGGAFGIFAGGPAALRLPLFVGVSLAAVVALCWFLYRIPAHRRMVIAACGAVLGGALGNLIDRLTFGEVVDFLDVFYRDYHWPTFNLADSFITIGVVVMVLDSIGRREFEGR